MPKFVRSKPFMASFAVILLLSVGGVFAGLSMAQDKPNQLAEGDKHFAEKSYRKAYEAYEAYLKENPKPSNWFELKLRMGHCQAQLGNFDKAELELLSLADHKGLSEIQQGRANYRLGRFFAERPHYYYENKKGEKSWGTWQQDSKYVDLSRSDAESAHKRLKLSFDKLRPLALNSVAKLGTEGAESVAMFNEAFNAGLDAAAALQAWQYYLGQQRIQVDYFDRNEQKQSYYYYRHDFPDRDTILKQHDDLVAMALGLKQAATSLEKQGRKLEAPIAEAAKLARTRGHIAAAMATYRKGCFLVSYNQLDDWSMRELLYHPDLQDFDPLKGEYSPLPILASVYKDYHDTEFADDAQFYIGYVLGQVGRHQESEQAYEVLVKDEAFKESTETASAKYMLQQLRAERLQTRTKVSDTDIASDKRITKWHDGISWSFREGGASNRSLFKRGERIGLWTETRNVKQFKVRALTFNLPGMMKDAEFLAAHTAGLSHIGDAALQGVIARYIGEKVFEKAYETGDDGKRNYTRMNFQLPETLPVGSYLVEVDTGSVVNRRLIMVSESQLVVQTYNPVENLAIFVDATSGAPLANTEFVYKRWRQYWSNDTYVWQVDSSRYTSDAQGRVRIPTGGSVGWQGWMLYAESAGRYAWHQSGFEWWQQRGADDSTTADVRVYPMTDRPVYRPGDEVHGKIILRRRDGGEWRNVPGMSAHLEIRDARGEERFSRQISANDFGALEYDLPLAKDAALGNWRFIIRSSKSGNWLGSGHFAVEEYKKPEFEVLVSPPDKPVKLGEAISANIRGEYYFGGPAAGADVNYKVFRDFYFHSVYFPRRYDWLYNWQSPVWYGTPDMQFNRNAGSELITEGKGKLNEQGELVIEWNTAKALTDWPEYDHQYRVECEVTDASRRTINGSGAVKALRRAFFAFVDNRLGFYRPNDKLDIEVRTVTADNKPVAAKGTLEMHKVTFSKRTDENGMPRIDESRTLVKTWDLNTDERGLALFNEKVTEAGTFDLVYKTVDEWGTTIEGSTRIIVKADTWMPGSYRFGTLSLIPQTRVYTQGETAKVLLASDFKDAWMLISVIAGREVISQSFLSTGETGGQFELEILMGREHIPNFHINVLTVQNGELHTNTLELFVPPDHEFLDVQVTSDKDQYQPGEKGKLTVTAKDKFGNPVAAEFALTVFDRSVTYIAPDRTPNIIKHFYGDRRWYRLNYRNSYQTAVNPNQVDLQKYEELRWYGAPLGWGVRNWMDWERNAFNFADERQDRTERYQRGFAGKTKEAGGRNAENPEDELNDALRDEEGLGGGAGGNVARRARGGGGRAADAAAPGAAPGAEAEDANEETRESAKTGSADKKAEKADWGEALANEEGVAVPRVRSNFKDTAFYAHRVTTGRDGKATVEVQFPDNLTDWRIAARGITSVAKVGEAFHSVKTTKRLILRDQAPRFFVEGDVVTLSGIIMNRYETALAVKAMLVLNPKDTATKEDLAAFCRFELFPETPDVQVFDVPAGGEIRVDWRIRMTGAGKFNIRMLALTTVESDATEKSFYCKVRGAEMYQAHTAVINDGEKAAQFMVDLPQQMDPEQTYMDLQLSPSVAALAMDALPYLLEFPYGCVEQTMSRFLPAVLVRKTLQDAGLNLEDIAARRSKMDYEGVNPQAAYWYKRNPVFDTGTLNAILDSGIKRLAFMQHASGGWGWWQGGYSDTYMSAYVAYGLHTAKEAGVAFDHNMLTRCISFLRSEARKEKDLHRVAYIAYVLSYAGNPDKELLDKIYDRRDDLTHQSRAMNCMAQWLAGDKERARILISNIEDYRKEDTANGTTWWDGGKEYWWWYNDKIETNAFVMQAFTMVDPTNKYLEKHVRWLAQNRKGSRWNSTKDTSHAVSALMAYAKATGELSRSYTVTVKRNGEPIHSWQVTPQNVFSMQTNVRLRGSQLPPGKHNFTIEREGEGKVYFSSFVSYFSKEDKLKATGNQIHIERKYYKLIEKNEEVTVRKTMPDGTVKEVKEMRKTYDRELLEYGAKMVSGDKIEVELGITADNDYEYLSFEDFKPAGCEPLALRSGGGYAGGTVQNVELRDDRVAFFMSYMRQGYFTLRYQLRCEIPGTFSALPTQGGSMYVSEVRANSEEWKVTISDK
ncbi:MAG: hypothetical protein KF696_12255 [Planctomycetes bacterium]|nr:hypothetical protein [Planctomycetota bacterium]MCW8136573.1 hypothetical protein [Planctomycetota bacterium]